MFFRLKTICSIATLVVCGALILFVLSTGKDTGATMPSIPAKAEAHHDRFSGAGYPGRGDGCTTTHNSNGTTTIRCDGNNHTLSMGWYILKLPKGTSPDINYCNTVDITCYGGDNISSYNPNNVALNQIYLMGQRNGNTAEFTFTRPSNWNSYSFYILTNFATASYYEQRWQGRAGTRYVCAWTQQVATNTSEGAARWLSPTQTCTNPPYPPPPDCTTGCGGTITGRVYNTNTSAGIQGVNIEIYRWRGSMNWWAGEIQSASNGTYTYTNNANDANTYTYSVRVNPAYRGGGSTAWTQVVPTSSNGYTDLSIGSTNINFSLRPPVVAPTSTPTPIPPTRTPTPIPTRTPTPIPTRTPTPIPPTPTPTTPSGPVITVRGLKNLPGDAPRAVVLDQNQNGTCRDDSAMYTTNAVNVTLRNGGASSVGTSIYSATPPVLQYLVQVPRVSGDNNLVLTATVSEAGYQVVEYRNNGSSNTIPGIWVGGSALEIFGATSSTYYVDLCVSNASSAWFQTDVGDVRMRAINNPVPSSGSISTVPTGYTGTDRSVYFSNSVDGVYGSGTNSVPQWQVNNEYGSNANSANYQGKLSYTYLSFRADSTNSPTRGVPSCTDADTKMSSGDYTVSMSVTASQLESNQEGIIYRHNGNLTIGGYSQNGAVKRVVILVDGDINVQSSIVVPNTNDSLLILASKGNINIRPNVGGLVTQSSPNITAILSAETNPGVPNTGHITIMENSSCPSTSDRQLWISGALIANAQRPFSNTGGGEVRQLRTLCDNNGTYPALKVTSRFQFVTSLTDFYKVSGQKWNEIQP